MLVFVSIFPPMEVTEEINLLVEKYGQNFKRLAPHITIVPPFSPTKEIAPAIKRLTRDLAKREPPLVTLDGIGNFKRRLNSVLYVDVVDTNELREIQNLCFSILESYGAGRGKYKEPNFHITIAKRLRLPKLFRMKGELTKMVIDDTFEAPELTVCVIEKNEPWQTKERIHFGKKNNTK